MRRDESLLGWLCFASNLLRNLREESCSRIIKVASNEMTATQTPVWVLMFDRLPADSTKGGSCRKTAEPAAIDFSPFDHIDADAVFFENYVVQDVRTSATISDIFGDAECIETFSHALRVSGRSFRCLQLTLNSAKRTDQSPSLLRQLLKSGDEFDPVLQAWLDRISVAEFDPTCLCRDPALQSAFAADLVWLDVQTAGTEDCPLVPRILECVNSMMHSAASNSSTEPILLVSALRGSERLIGLPFTFGLNESLVRVPLWIRTGTSGGSRIQSLAGSCDLLPTILELLTGKPPVGTAAGNGTSTTTEACNGRRFSLVPACRDSTAMPDRLLRLRGDHWEALRSQSFLLVQSRETSAESAGLVTAEKVVRHLYLKPDDFWNIHDVIGEYETVAEEMIAQAKRGGISEEPAVSD